MTAMRKKGIFTQLRKELLMNKSHLLAAFVLATGCSVALAGGGGGSSAPHGYPQSQSYQSQAEAAQSHQVSTASNTDSKQGQAQ
jgi:hypothetical protein